MARKRKVSESDFLDSSNSSDSESNSQTPYKRPQARNAANARERARMRVLSKAFTRLKTSLPWVPADTKLSKLDTLRLAASYISHLKQILAEDNTFPSTPIHPLNLTWPFTLHNRPSNHQDEVEQTAQPNFNYLHSFDGQLQGYNNMNMAQRFDNELVHSYQQSSSSQCYEYF